MDNQRKSKNQMVKDIKECEVKVQNSKDIQKVWSVEDCIKTVIQKSESVTKLDGRGYKRMQSRSLESNGYSESIVSGRLHQNSDLEVRKCGKTCKRGPAWFCDINNT